MRRESFERLVAKAIAELPEEFRERLENVAVVIQPRPTPRQLARARVRRGSGILGLYEGVPHPRRTTSYGMVAPDKITIFQKPIELKCGRDEGEIRREVRRVVLHEIGHHFGMDEKTLQRLESETEARYRTQQEQGGI